ncbi:MAG: nicotinate (nicotinamide) nucleotide adenylyltransferase [Planctomycetota bacterium]|jgi:nicotinate-nucleotide adenylyltransferase
MLIVFGGSFDPVHLGHLAMADAAQEHLAPDHLLWVPSGHAPHKPDLPPAAPEERAAFLHAVVDARPGEEVCEMELERPGFSYTVDTLQELKRRYPKAEFGFLLGGDSLAHLLTWRDLPTLFDLVEFLFVPRSGWGEGRLAPFREALPRELKALFRARFLPMQVVDASSTEIRAELDEGRIPDTVPQAVASLIRAGGCYGFGG